MDGWIFVSLIALAVIFYLFVFPRLRRRAIRNQVEKLARDPNAPAPVLHPESESSITIEGDRVIHTREDGTTEAFLWSDLEKVSIITTSDGPFLPDIFWRFEATGDTGACVPQGATGDDQLRDCMLALPDFDSDRFIVAMASTSDAAFDVWRRQPKS